LGVFHSLTRKGEVAVDEGLPIRLEVESMAVGHDGLLYLVAAPPPGTVGEGRPATPFTREIGVFTRDGVPRGKLALECETYTRYLRVIGIDRRGWIYARQAAGGGRGSFTVFDQRGRPLISQALPDGAEVADAYVGPDGNLYVSVAGEEGYGIVKYVMKGRWRLEPRFGRRGGGD